MLLLLIYQVSKMVTKYILAHYSIRDGEIEYGDKALYEVHVAESTTQEALDLAVIKQLAEENFGEENEDWEYNAKEQYVEGIHGEYRILESNGGDEIPKEHFDVLKIYLGSDIIEVA